MQKIIIAFILVLIFSEVNVFSEIKESREIKIATVLWQTDSLTTKEQNLQRAILFIHQAGRKKTDVILFPENVLASGLPIPVREPVEPVTGNSLNLIRQVAARNQIYVIFPFLELAAKKIFNSAVIIDRNGGITGVYRQTHRASPPDMNSEITAGDLFPVFELDFAKVGILIGFDVRFPEVGEILALSGAEIIFLPHQLPFVADLDLSIICRTRALDNEVYWITSSKINVDELLPEGKIGTTLIIDPKGEVIADQFDSPGILFHTIEMPQSVKGVEKQATWRIKRRPEIYQKLIESTTIE